MNRKNPFALIPLKYLKINTAMAGRKGLTQKVTTFDVKYNNTNANLTKTTAFRKKTFVGLFKNILSFSPKI